MALPITKSEPKIATIGTIGNNGTLYARSLFLLRFLKMKTPINVIT